MHGSVLGVAARRLASTGLGQDGLAVTVVLEEGDEGLEDRDVVLKRAFNGLAST